MGSCHDSDDRARCGGAGGGPAVARRRPGRRAVGRAGRRALQEQIAAVTPQVLRLQGWLQTAAGRLEQTTGGTLPIDDGCRARSVAGWLADVQHATAGAAGSQLRTARLLHGLPLVVAAVLDGLLTPAQAAVLTRLVGKIDAAALVESQPELIAVAAVTDPSQLGCSGCRTRSPRTANRPSRTSRSGRTDGATCCTAERRTGRCTAGLGSAVRTARRSCPRWNRSPAGT
jgi:hypothetical protein